MVSVVKWKVLLHYKTKKHLNRVVIKETVITQLVKIFPAFMECRVLSPCSQMPTIRSYAESVKSNLQLQTLSFQDTFIILFVLSSPK